MRRHAINPDSKVPEVLEIAKTNQIGIVTNKVTNVTINIRIDNRFFLIRIDSRFHIRIRSID
jgi:hypothetical protein